MAVILMAAVANMCMRVFLLAEQLVEPAADLLADLLKEGTQAHGGYCCRRAFECVGKDELFRSVELTELRGNRVVRGGVVGPELGWF